MANLQQFGLLATLVVCLLSADPAFTKPPPTKQPTDATTQAQQKYREMAKKSQCPNGIPWLVGSWKYIGQSKVPNFTDRITFKGANYTEHISGGYPSRQEKGVLTGDYACLFSNRILLRIKTATPEGVFGNSSGDDYPCDVLTPINATRNRINRVLLVCFVEWNLQISKGLDLEFERVVPTKKPAPPAKAKKTSPANKLPGK
jgi:hypothetical protein